MQIVLTDDEVRRTIGEGIYARFGLASEQIVLHQSGTATVYVADESDEDSDEEG